MSNLGVAAGGRYIGMKGKIAEECTAGRCFLVTPANSSVTVTATRGGGLFLF